ncbi:hypothetical protein JL09_g1371 [Pichia kudriavzevii]|uniref:TOG domain-containing protein n=1 Tax=Pichia kudriavzevii TaxID=4909 RepID=A0A099P5K6_PICKU|nr:hypothetical protein JL09_g1371 [Pichia kudriavzevii]
MSDSPADKWVDDVLPLLEQLRQSSVNTMNVSIFKLNAVLADDHEKLDSNQKDQVLFAILSTYARYPFDSTFDKNVLKSFQNFIAIDGEKFSKHILGFIAKQSTKPIATRELLILSRWNSAVINYVDDNDLFLSLLKVCTASSINLLSLVTDYSQVESLDNHHLKAIKSIKTDIASSLRSIAKKNPEYISDVINHICVDKLPSNSEAIETLKSFETKIYEFFVKVCSTTKIYPNKVALHFFGTFINMFLSAKSFEEILIPGLEKSALRNSELTFSIYSPSIFESLNYSSMDVALILSKTKFFGQLFSSLKATKESVKIGASATLNIIVKNTSSASGDSLVLYADELFKVLKGISASAVEQKCYILDVLSSFEYSNKNSSKKIIEMIIPFITKENNEVVLNQLLNILLPRFIFFISSATEFDQRDKIIELLNAGLKNSKAPIKTAWNTAFASAMLSSCATGESIEQFALLFNSGITDTLLTVFDEVMKAPLPSVNNKLIAAGYSSIATLFHLVEAFDNQTLAEKLNHFDVVGKALTETETKMSCFTNTKVVSKLNTEESQEWFVRALLALSRHLTEPSTLYGSAALYASISRNMTPKVRNLSRSLLHEHYEQNQKVIGSSLTLAVNRTIVPILSRIIEDDLSTVKSLDIDETKYQIWKGKDGELVVDVLAKKTSVNISKSKDAETLKWEQSVRKELEAKKKVAKKLTKEEQIKVNEQLLLEKSIRDTINSQYMSLRRGLAVITCLSRQARTVDNGTAIWFPVAISNILTLLNSKPAVKLTGELSSECFLSLSDVVATESLSGTSSMKFVGSSTLRLHDVDHIPAEYTGRDLQELLSSQLFSLKLSSDKSLFNSLTLMYVLPLLVKIIENGKNYIIRSGKKITKVNTEFSEEAPEEEQLTMALEIISSNSELFEDHSIPRTSIITHLIELLALSSKAKAAKECFVSLCQNIAATISDSDLTIILKSLINPNVFVRATILEVLDQEFDLSDLKMSEELWILCFDNVTNNKEVAETIWAESGFQIDEGAPTRLIEYIGNPDNGMRLSISKAIAAAVIKYDSVDLFHAILDKLLKLFREMAQPPAPEVDQFGLVINNAANAKDRWEQRCGIALALNYMAPLFKNESEVSKVFKFLIEERALGDKEIMVRSELQEAGSKIIEQHGKENVETLISIFEACLAEKDEKSKIQDLVKESVIILYGGLARHLDDTDKRIDSIVERLLESLDTPSEDVQYAVSECISPLVPFIQSKLSSIIDNLFEKLFVGKSLAVRRGAAYGIAGLAKGVGIKALSEYDIIRNLTEASDDKKDSQKRESVLFAFECISQSFGPLFEPYVIEILPIVLRSFGDSSAEVREATDYAARIIMKNTTSYGIKKMIPLAIENLDDFAWRTKKGSVELLGSMAYLDPAQLSSSLPEIVPEIVGVLNDSHKEVRKAADAALKKFGEVIRNPEIQELVPILLKAIGDPTKYTNDALDSLINTQFVHYIDGPSLALIIRVINRGMQASSANTKKKACQIVGNMAILVDSHDLMPYLSQLVNELIEAVVDPVPQTRATAARALGSLVEKLGEEKFPGLISNLLADLQDESKRGDRLGAAQALAEIISGLGIAKLEEMLPIIIQGTTSSKSFVREGFMPLLLFLPVCFGSQFAPYLSQTIPPILAGLADNNEDIRDVSLRTGRLIVNNYAKKAVDLLLPELEKGLSDYNARIRLSSVELTGELLFKISGISGKQELADDVSLSKNVTKAFNEVLGDDRRNTVLSNLFVCRSDTSGAVRATAANIWKALVANTPRTIKEILPTLLNIIVRRLASPDDIQRNIVAATLGDMIRRVGGNALSQILPTLKEAMVSSDSDAKQGICIALYEIITSTAENAIIEHQGIFVGIVKEALVDPNPSVREAAAQAFDSLQESIGNSAVDEVIPQLLEMLNTSDGSEDALSALQEIMSTKSDVIFPILIPSLLTPPINGRAIGALAEAAGSALYKRLSTIINALVDGIANKLGDEEELYSALTRTLISVDSDEGCHPLLQQILALMKHEDVNKKKIIYNVLPEFFKESTLDYSIYIEDVVSHCIYLLNDPDDEIVSRAFETLSVLVKKQPKQVLERLVIPAQQTLSFIQNDSKQIKAFALPRGPGCVLPIFLQGLMYGNPVQRETSANGMSIIIDNAPAVNLKPFVTTIVGPLIRVIGERFSSDIKSAILLAINKLFNKIPQFLLPFIPQLQRTFIKSLSDPSSEILRTRAARALGTLIKYQPKVDPLVTELLNNAKGIDSSDVPLKTAILKALLEVVDKAGNKMSEASKNGVMVLVEEEMFNDEAGVGAAVAYAKLVGALSKILEPSELTNMVKNKILSANLNDENSSRFAILTLNAFLKDSAVQVLNSGLFNEICEFMIAASNSSKPYVTDNATIAIGKFVLSLDKVQETDGEIVRKLINQLAVSMIRPTSNSLDTRRLSLVVVRTICRYQYEVAVSPNLDILIPSVFSCVRDPILPVKLAAEKAILAVLNSVDDESNIQYNSWIDSLNGANTVTNAVGTTIQLRSITEYVKRVVVRLANVERERITAGGDKEAMFSDQFEDESEIWAIGGVELSEE